MIIKAVFFVGDANPNARHERVLEVYDFHIETLTSEALARDGGLGVHELIYHTVNGKTGTLRLGRHSEHADHLYVMENGKTIDHMTFNA